MAEPIEVVTRYLRLLEAFETDPARFEPLLHPDYVQTEHPNLLNRTGQRSDLRDAYRRMALGKKIMARQQIDVLNHVVDGNKIVVEAAWAGTMAVDAGPLKAGQSLKARMCMVFELRDGRIHRQANYDCFEPF